MKRVVSLILAALLALSLFAACGEKEPEPTKTTTGFDSFEITYYWGPQGASVTNKVFWELAKEAGFTSVPIENATVEENLIALGYLKELGLTCSALFDSRISRMLSRSYSEEDIENLFNELKKDYADYLDIIKGWWFKDEPTAANFKYLGKTVGVMKRVDPDRTAFINIFGCGKNGKMDTERWGADSYPEFVEQYLTVTDPHYLCFGNYHFTKKGTAKPQFFTNFEMIRSAALEKNLDYMIHLQLIEHGNGCASSRAQLFWEVNMALCYGAKRYSFFTFVLPDASGEWVNAIVDLNANKEPHFDMVKEVNEMALPLGRELFYKRSEAVFHLTSDPATLEMGCTAYESHGNLGKVTGDEFVIGFFDDGCFMVVNERWKEGDEGKNSIVFDEIAAGLEYFDTATASWKTYETKNGDGKYVFNTDAGEALLFRVAK